MVIEEDAGTFIGLHQNDKCAAFVLTFVPSALNVYPPTARDALGHGWRRSEEAACPWKFALRSKVIPLNPSLISCPRMTALTTARLFRENL
ncbi:unnamed protein product [Arctogadus glacialis]